jgi:hypothetical protein
MTLVRKARAIPASKLSLKQDVCVGGGGGGVVRGRGGTVFLGSQGAGAGHSDGVSARSPWGWWRR